MTRRAVGPVVLAVVLVAMAVLGACTPSAGDLTAPTARPGDTPTTGGEAVPPQTPPPRPRGPSGCAVSGGPGGGGDAGSKVSYEQPLSAGQPLSAQRLSAAGAPSPAGQAAPWKDRPTVSLCFDVRSDPRVVRGSEQVTFTPGRRTCEIVFRAWPNKPETARAGNRLEVTSAAVDGRKETPKVEAAGAPPGSPGTLVKVPVRRCVAAGRTVQVDLTFTLTVGENTPERVGYSTRDRAVWLGTAYPLLAWQRGKGWVTDPAVDLFGETVTSEEFRLRRLDVVAPAGDQVLGTGQAVGSMPSTKVRGSVVHRFRADSVRDVAITAGRLRTQTRDVDGVRVHVGVPDGSVASAGEWADATAAAIRALSSYLGPFPYHDLWVTVADGVGTGIEFPGAIQFGNVSPTRYPQLVPHEVAHMWFYGLVGNDQARDPWLDEALAEYAETLVDGTGARSARFQAPSRVRDRVGESMAWYAALRAPDLYAAGVYRQGGAMLHRARQAAGPATFDRLLRGYVSANAHRIATPRDFARAFASRPKVIAILREYGAIPR
ncbi:M1 family aminopeptidase [Actinopolymorpha sp. NPDC004070]|uniref:M1 family aminopeptidase n=1 Tax=Actinopolymorpha sp. NPDC004070 TaxID=3154548 RepID=UPI0033A049FD